MPRNLAQIRAILGCLKSSETVTKIKSLRDDPSSDGLRLSDRLLHGGAAGDQDTTVCELIGRGVPKHRRTNSEHPKYNGNVFYRMPRGWREAVLAPCGNLVMQIQR